MLKQEDENVAFLPLAFGENTAWAPVQKKIKVF